MKDPTLLMNTVNQCLQTKSNPQVENLINDIELMNTKDLKGGQISTDKNSRALELKHQDEIQSLQLAY